VVRRLLLFATSSVVISLSTPAPAFDVCRNLQRPPSQAGADSTTSWAEKTLTWPAGGGSLDFDYFVDSEEGWDFLKVLIDGSPLYSWSGPQKAGHVNRSMTAGPHVIRYEYVKDGSVHHGLDTGGVTAIVARDALGVMRRFHFDDRTGGLQGWIVGGSLGGFSVGDYGRERAIRRPVAQAFTGYIPSPTTSRAERTFNFSGAGPHGVRFAYSVDSEPNYDFLRIFVDGALSWQISGQASGTKSIDVTAGTHTIAFEYYKDTSVDVGRDLAVIDNVEALTDRAAFEIHRFDGNAVGTLPYGWTGTGSSGSFVLAQAVPPIARAEAGTPAMLPTIDGRIGLDEYVSPTIAPLLDRENARGRNGTLFLRERDDLASLLVGARVHASSVAVGTEAGSFTLYFDAARGSTLSTLGCGANGATPAAEDRKIVITYSSSSGQPTVSTAQYRGSCQGWVAVTAGAEWPTVVELREPEEDQGFIHLELRIELKPAADATSSVLAEGRVGFALVHRSTSGALGTETYPIVQGGEPLDNDVWSWATLDFTSNYSDARPIDGIWRHPSYFY